MNRLQDAEGRKAFFIENNINTLNPLKERALRKFLKIEVYTYSPLSRSEFLLLDNKVMVYAVNNINPDVLFIGMTSPNLEKWVYEHYKQLNRSHLLPRFRFRHICKNNSSSTAMDNRFKT